MWLHLPLLALLTFQAPIAAPIAARLQTPSNLKAQQVVSAAIAALGGDHYLQANERSGAGRLYAFDSTGQLADPGTRFWSWQRFPSDERLELTKQRNVIEIYRGGQGWEVTYKGVAPMLKKQLENYADRNAHSLDIILKTWAQDPRTLMLDLGLVQVDQAQAEEVSFTTNAGDAATVDFSVTTHLPLRVSWRRDDAQTGGHYVESVIYGTWTHIGAIAVPFTIDHFEGPQRQDQRFYDSMSFAPFPDSMFVPRELKH